MWGGWGTGQEKARTAAVRWLDAGKTAPPRLRLRSVDRRTWKKNLEKKERYGLDREENKIQGQFRQKKKLESEQNLFH